MERTIRIGEQELKLRSSLLTIITYKNTFGTDLFGDVQKLDTSKKASKVKDEKEVKKVTKKAVKEDKKVEAKCENRIC